jgi:hypothetical protein
MALSTGTCDPLLSVASHLDWRNVFTVAGRCAMSAFRLAIAIGLLLAAVAPVRAADPQPLDLTGAWATDVDQCAKVFNRQGDKVTFSDMSDLYGGGFIIEQDHITGKSARCTIASRRRDGDTLHLLASCATEIMYSKVQFSLKVVNDNSVTRLFPGMPEIALNYQRCRF